MSRSAPLVVRELPGAPSPESFFGFLSRRPGAFLLDSAARGGGVDPAISRWSFFGCDPFLTLSARGGDIRLETAREGNRPASVRTQSGDPWKVLQQILGEFPAGNPGEGRSDGLPPFTTGAVGFLGYDLKHHIERLPEPGAPREMDDLWLGFAAAVGAWDHEAESLRLLSRGLQDGGGENAARRALDDLERVVERAVDEANGSRDARGDIPPGDPLRAGGADEPTPGPSARGDERNWSSSFTRGEYEEAVRFIQRRIAAGEIYQANLSQRFDIASAGEAWPLYAALRLRSPAPFGAFLRCGELEILSASPELFLRRRGDVVETRPIKGTRPRGVSPAADERLAGELLASEKDRAELVMIVDLERNDLGRVCRIGSIEVPELFRLESWATVHHLVATVRGRLNPGIGPVDLLRAAFPGGSITGAPKIRAMEILDRVERTRRGAWTGAVGWIDTLGDLDLHVAIRTAYRLRGRAWIQAGGGITSPSEPAAEYEETLAKARALAEAIAPGRRFPPRDAAAGAAPGEKIR